MFITGSNTSKENNPHKLDDSKPEKFEQVENALEAMFGLDEKSGTPDCVRQFLYSLCFSPRLYVFYNIVSIIHVGKNAESSDDKKGTSGSNKKTKDKGSSNQKKATSQGNKKLENKVVEKSLKMTKVSTPEKSLSGSQKKTVKRNLPKDEGRDRKTATKKPGRPRSDSTTSGATKRKDKGLPQSSHKNKSLSDYQNGKSLHEDMLDRNKGI